MRIAEEGGTETSRGYLRPLGERVLAGLPGARVLWIAAGPWFPGRTRARVLLDTERRSAVWEQSRVLVVINYAALSLAIVISLVGAHFARRLEALRSSTSKVFRCDACAPFPAR